jgi:hypothetical protein
MPKEEAGRQPVLLARDRDKLGLRRDDADGVERLPPDELYVRGPDCCRLSHASIARRTQCSALSSAKYGWFASLNVRIYHVLCQSGNVEVRIE